MTNAHEQDSDIPFVIDTAAIIAVSLAICFWSHRLLLMSLFVPAVILLRFLLLKKTQPDLRAEIFFFIICTLLGAFNDWNSVVHHRIYDYTVPHEFEWSTIPLWMLLFWGMILRFFARIARWKRLGSPEAPSNVVRLGNRVIDSAPLKILLFFALTFVTRRFIYNYYLHPFWSWFPFLCGIIFYFSVFAPTRHDYKLTGLFLLGGPLIEILYINAGGLHRYHLGWFFGVPLWIILWWMLAVLIWKDLSFRIERGLNSFFKT